jgi:hypothetical protein
MFAHGLENVPSGDRILVEVFARALDAKPHIGIGCEVDHHFHARHRLGQTAAVEQISTMESEPRMGCSGFQKLLPPGGKIIEADHAVTRGQQTIYHVAADESRRTCNQDAQMNPHLLLIIGRRTQHNSRSF